MEQATLTHQPANEETLPWRKEPGSHKSVSSSDDFIPMSEKSIRKICQKLQPVFRHSASMAAELKTIAFPVSGIARINDCLPKVVEDLFNKSNGIAELSSDNMTGAIKSLAKSIGRGNLSEVIISIGLGASDAMPSLRLPSYVIPAVRVLKKIQERHMGIGLPTVRVFKATHAGVYANGLNLEKAKQVGEITMQFLSGFINQFYPELSDAFVFESDVDYRNSPAYSNIIDLANRIRNLTGIEKELSVLKTMGEKHGGSLGVENTFFYAAAHPVYNQAIIAKSNPGFVTPFTEQNPQPKLIIDFGGRPQRTFNSVVEALRPRLNTTEFILPALINVIVKTGKVPVYYKAKQGDILLSDVCRSFDDFTTDPLTKDDYELLFEDIADSEYLSYVNQFQQQNRIKIV